MVFIEFNIKRRNKKQVFALDVVIFCHYGLDSFVVGSQCNSAISTGDKQLGRVTVVITFCAVWQLGQMHMDSV